LTSDAGSTYLLPRLVGYARAFELLTLGDMLDAKEALRTIAMFRLALPRTILRYAGGREITLGDLGTREGLLGGINAVIVGNYLTTLGRDPADDLVLLDELAMPVKALSATL
jgi:biotin synthase